MDTATAHRLTEKYPLGPLLTEGKTKKIHWSPNCDSDKVIVISKDDITAGDGAKHDVIPNKGRLANETTCNVFRLLKACGLPVAFEEQDSVTSFVAPCCEMLPYEVVVRREAHGSYLKRNPYLSKGHLFPQLLCEFFLKTKNKKWISKAGDACFREYKLVCDDPYMLYAGAGTGLDILLFDPAKPIHVQEPFLVLPSAEVFSRDDEQVLFPEMRRIACQAFLVLEKAWQIEGRKLVDFKVEFGFDREGHLLLADVIDNDSWRVIENGAHIDKQVYRDGGALGDVTEKYRQVAKITGHFQLPRQRIILWRGSEKDDLDSFKDDLDPFFDTIAYGLEDAIKVVTCSIHKEPGKAVAILHRLVQEVPDSVVIAYIGKSNGAGPVLSAASTVPVITVPASVKEFPADVWSSLRTPSNVPVMTVLEPSNAALAAMQILSARNPRLYAYLRGEVEKRLVNTVSI